MEARLDPESDLYEEDWPSESFCADVGVCGDAAGGVRSIDFGFVEQKMKGYLD